MRVISRGGYRRAGRGPKPGCRCLGLGRKVFKFFPYTFPQLFKLFFHRAVNDTFSTPSLPPCPAVVSFFLSFFFLLSSSKKKGLNPAEKELYVWRRDFNLLRRFRVFPLGSTCFS